MVCVIARDDQHARPPRLLCMIKAAASGLCLWLCLRHSTVSCPCSGAVDSCRPLRTVHSQGSWSAGTELLKAQVTPEDTVTLSKKDLERYIDHETQDLYDHMKRLHSRPKPPDLDHAADEAEIANLKLKLQIMQENRPWPDRPQPLPYLGCWKALLDR